MKQLPTTKGPILFDRVATILDQARGRVLRTVNQQMVLAYGLIGREIVLEVQQGARKAGYGEDVLRDLSLKLANRYGKGYSFTSLKDIRQFYLCYRKRFSGIPKYSQISHDSRGLFEKFEFDRGFSPKLGWTHYRALMRVKNPTARDYYESEADFNGWNTEELERQIHSQTFERLKTKPVRSQINHEVNPIVASAQLEQAIITNLQAFMLELGKGFAFVARQRQLRFDDQLYYVDLVFYNYLLKCFVLVDLKIGEITHQDVGQMDGYVRLFEDQYKVQGDNPTIGLILCSAPNHAVAKYSVLSEAKQLFASQYLLHLPTEQELTALLEQGRRNWEARTAHCQSVNGACVWF